MKYELVLKIFLYAESKDEIQKRVQNMVQRMYDNFIILHEKLEIELTEISPSEAIRQTCD